MEAHSHHADHDHDHDGGHDHAWREAQPPIGPASLLDIGGDVGAVSVRLAGDTPSGELMACPRGRPDDHFHTGVHLREVGAEQAWIALFPEVTEGSYSLLVDGVERVPFEVTGGQVTTLALDADMV